MSQKVINMENENNENENKSNRSNWVAGILGAGLVAVSGFAVYQNSQTEDLRREVSAYQQDISTLKTSVSAADAELQKTLGDLRDQLSTSQKDVSATLAKAQSASRRYSSSLVDKLEKKQAENQEAINAELSKVHATNEETTTKLTGINTEVATVKTDVATAKSDIDKTLADLQRVRGDMGVMSGLVATNSKEISALRELGDRNIFEFTVDKKTGIQKVGDIQVKLKKADVKRNRYTMEIVADDKTVEKKDKNTNEPVQFYVVSKARQPYEIVVNEVAKDRVTGYLATPKVSNARTN